MNESPTLDDFERTIAHTLNVKADQLVVDDEETFDADVSPTVALVRVPSDATRPRWIRQHRRRLLAMAAAVALLVGGAAILRTRSSNSGSVVASQNVVWASDNAFSMEVPSVLPDGWTITDVAPGEDWPTNSITWQLFAVDGPSPLPRGVLLGSEPAVSPEAPSGATITVRGEDAVTGPSNQPGIPVGAVEVDWAEGDFYHDVVAVGMTEDEVVDFLNSLTPRADGEPGFDAPAGTSLPELDVVTEADRVHMWGSTYRGPGGVGSLTIHAEDAPFGGGLLHRLVGEPYAGGQIIRNGDDDYQSVSLLRADGWAVDLSIQSPTILQEPGLLEAILESLQPVERQQLLDMALAQPVTKTAIVDGWSVEVRGQYEDLAMCLTSPGHDPVCTLAYSDPELTSGSALVDDEWVIVALTDGKTPWFETDPSRNAQPDSAVDSDDYETLEGTVVRSDGQVVELVRVPAHVEAVQVMVPDGPNRWHGTGHLRPSR